ncbi:MAG TPA: T9SS type A sorting domain-containing protein, partial [Niastella sp.]
TSIPDTTAPVITSFTPTSGKKGTVVTIFGSHLTGVFAVRFGGVSADSLVVLSDTVMQAIVDTGATGNVTIFKGFRSATKAGFIFIGDSTIGDTSFVYTLTSVENGQITRTPKPFALYPNPASTYVIWQHPVTDHATRLQLIDISGRVVRQVNVGKAVSQTTVNVSGLNAGVYKLVWIDGKSKLTRTLLVK